jgi:hypothetical protein
VEIPLLFYYIFFWSYIIYVNYSFPTDAKHGDYDAYTVKADGVISLACVFMKNIVAFLIVSILVLCVNVLDLMLIMISLPSI